MVFQFRALRHPCFIIHIEDGGKEHVKHLFLVRVPVCKDTIHILNRSMLSLCSHLPLKYLKKLFIFPHISWQFLFQLSFGNFLPQVASSISYSSSVTWPCFQWTYPSLLCLISTRTFLFSLVSLLPHLLDLRHLGISCSCVLRRWYLKLTSSGLQHLQKRFPTGLYWLLPWAAQSLLTSCPVLRFSWHFSSH